MRPRRRKYYERYGSNGGGSFFNLNRRPLLSAIIGSMKRWGIALLAVILACVPILLSHVTTHQLLQDSDTAFLLKTVRERQAPLSWFTGDWPLGNHFYRPVSTLTFEMD